jgi:hypothetical protein
MNDRMNDRISNGYIKSLIDYFWFYFKILFLAGSVYTVLVPILILCSNINNKFYIILFFIHIFWHFMSFLVYFYSVRNILDYNTDIILTFHQYGQIIFSIVDTSILYTLYFNNIDNSNFILSALIISTIIGSIIYLIIFLHVDNHFINNFSTKKIYLIFLDIQNVDEYILMGIITIPLFVGGICSIITGICNLHFINGKFAILFGILNIIGYFSFHYSAVICKDEQVLKNTLILFSHLLLNIICIVNMILLIINTKCEICILNILPNLFLLSAIITYMITGILMLIYYIISIIKTTIKCIIKSTIKLFSLNETEIIQIARINHKNSTLP